MRDCTRATLLFGWFNKQHAKREGRLRNSYPNEVNRPSIQEIQTREKIRTHTTDRDQPNAT